MTRAEDVLLHEIWTAAGGSPALIDQASRQGIPILESRYPVSALASSTIAAAGLALAELVAATGRPPARVHVDRELADRWFDRTLRPQGWTIPPPWDPIAGDYRSRDGWIRLHTNAPQHRAAALRALALPDDAERPAVSAAVATWSAGDLETAVVAAGGCAAELRAPAQWHAHAQGAAVAAEPLIACRVSGPAAPPTLGADARRPLRGLRVLDLTRVLAGPAATRLLAGWGADVVRVDPIDRDEPGVEVEMTLGKACARVDLRTAGGHTLLVELLRGADVLVHGYRPGALDGLGLDAATRRRLRPGLVDVALDAYGFTGPWHRRRGFDSLVQMSSGIAFPASGDAGDPPAPLPVQALDHATGYLAATAALRGVTIQVTSGAGSEWRVSLARTAALLAEVADLAEPAPPPAHTPTAGDRDAALWRRASAETTGWGPALRLPGPVMVGPAELRWDRPAAPLGSAEPAWSTPAESARE